MPPFQQTSLTLAQAKTAVASSSQNPDDAEQLALAQNSIQAALRHWNNICPWTWLHATATVSAAGGVGTAALPADYRYMYEVKLQGNDPRTLFYTTRRAYNRAVYDQSANDVPTHYTLFYAGATGAMEFVDIPAVNTTADLYYHRRITIATATAAALDFPDDYVDYLIAWAKWHYLNDKGEMTERAKGWLAYAQEGISEMKTADGQNPDNILAFTPNTDLGNMSTPPSSLAELRAWYGR